jgi:hypothetical protein
MSAHSKKREHPATAELPRTLKSILEGRALEFLKSGDISPHSKKLSVKKFF